MTYFQQRLSLEYEFHCSNPELQYNYQRFANAINPYWNLLHLDWKSYCHTDLWFIFKGCRHSISI